MERRISSEKYWELRRKNARNAWQVRRTLGRSLELYVSDVLRSAMEAGAPIKGVREARPFSPADRRGWDAVVIDNDGIWHPLQVKSSEAAAQEFRRRGAERGLPSIPVVVTRFSETPQQILDKIGKVIPFLRGFKLKKGDTK